MNKVLIILHIYFNLYSFEIDTLEIVLKEHVDVVDKMFIGENQF